MGYYSNGQGSTVNMTWADAAEVKRGIRMDARYDPAAYQKCARPETALYRLLLWSSGCCGIGTPNIFYYDTAQEARDAYKGCRAAKVLQTRQNDGNWR